MIIDPNQTLNSDHDESPKNNKVYTSYNSHNMRFVGSIDTGEASRSHNSPTFYNHSNIDSPQRPRIRLGDGKKKLRALLNVKPK